MSDKHVAKRSYMREKMWVHNKNTFTVVTPLLSILMKNSNAFGIASMFADNLQHCI